MMGILGIKNRTENWKTVQHFYGLSDNAKTRLVQRLGEPEDTPAEEIRVELFWQGMRDYIDKTDGKNKPGPEAIATTYSKQGLFRDLRERVKNFRAEEPPYKFNTLRPHNYDPSKENWEDLFNNLSKTEIDIVLETPNHLFIGEAKDESTLGTGGKYILVHQLIREYVMAKILVDLVQVDKLVVPFVVWDPSHPENLRNTVQVKFMLNQCWPDGQRWLREDNVLSWCDIKKLTNENSNPGA